VRRMQDLEQQDNILSVSFAHGFPWGDVEHTSAKVIVITDNDRDMAEQTAKNLGGEIWQMRRAAETKMLKIDDALDQAVAAAAKPVILADVADNAGGGAPSDSTFILEQILARQIPNVLSGLYWDPVAVRICEEAGEGATLDLRIGGKCGPSSGYPIDLAVEIMKILPKAQQSFAENKAAIGTAVWLRGAHGLDLVINSVRTQVFNPDAFSCLGIDPTEKDIVVVKSTQHFHAGFAPIAADILYVAAPGAITPDFANIPYRKFTAPYWPRSDNPFA